MSSNSFECSFCNMKLPGQIEFQEHFRSHAQVKTKKGVNNSFESKTQSVGNHPENELVPCDVCDEKFETVTKAISHKFRKHPDTPNNNFCPWCGKQFPIKQVRDSHLKTHLNLTEPVFKLPCAECGHEFFSGEAVKYHSQSFHRKAHVFQDVQTPPPSNKIYLNGHGDLLSVYYCHLCGQEYVIKYNLQKHINSVHGVEHMPPPGDIVKCKTCDALFYSVGAYEFHNTFHKPGDLYVTSEEMRKQVVTKVDQDFDFRRVLLAPVPPGKQTGNRGALKNPTLPVKKKKGKASPTVPVEPGQNAITLDEFVNMNKDLFGTLDSVPTEDLNIKTEPVLQNPGNSISSDLVILGPTTNAENIKKVFPRVKESSVVIKRLPLPKGVLKAGLKVMMKGDLELMQKQGIISLVNKPKLPTKANQANFQSADSVKNTRNYSKPKDNQVRTNDIETGLVMPNKNIKTDNSASVSVN